MTILDVATNAEPVPPRGVEPFRRDGLARRIGPFAAVALLAEASLALPPGPTSTTYSITSVCLLFVCGACVFLPWDRLPTWSSIVVPLLYIGSALTLVLGAGGSTSGIGIVILVPVVWTALYLRPTQSAVVVLAVILYQIVTSITPVRVADSVLARRVFLWLVLATLVSFATHELRSRLQGALDHRRDLIREREVALSEMGRSLGELKRRDHESRLLHTMTEMLQACASVEETYQVIENAALQLFPGGGALSVVNASSSLFETAISWGLNHPALLVFSPNECLALRRSQAHSSTDGGLSCTHLRGAGISNSLCLPMIAQGETIGVFHLFNEDSDARRQLAFTVSENIGISIANLRLRETLRSQSIRDPLTNLYNRRYMEETFAREIARATRDREHVAVVQIDVDHFKSFNDTYGHDFGDALLRSLGELFLETFRDVDVACRYGGEEFTLILPKCPIHHAERRAEELQKLVQMLEVPSLIDDEFAPGAPTMSIGIAVFPEHGNSAESLIRAADQALYSAKSQGRNMIVRAPSVSSGDFGPGRTTEPLIGDP